MRTLPLSAALMLAAATASLQAAEPEQERARIGAERAALHERANAEQKACWQKFAVNDCINNAKRRQRQALAELRQQEIVLDDEQRKKRAAARTQALDEKAAKAASRLDPERREQALAEQQRREARAAEKTAKRASGPQPAAPGAELPGNAAAAADGQSVSAPTASTQPRPSAGQEETSRKLFEDRQQKAQQRKAWVLKRQAEKGKPPAASLPLPP